MAPEIPPWDSWEEDVREGAEVEVREDEAADPVEAAAPRVRSQASRVDKYTSRLIQAYQNPEPIKRDVKRAHAHLNKNAVPVVYD
jgi:hypothetical protein